MAERKAQLLQQIIGIEAQMVATTRQHRIVASELEGQETLLGNGLTQLSQVSALQREEASLSGRLGELTATLAQTRGQIAEVEIEILRLTSNRREEAITTLLELQYNAVELRERRLSLSERINRLDIKAPRAGVIYGLQIKTLRAVITAAEPILYVVPADSYLVIRTRINAIDIDQLALNQPATLRFSAFDTRTTPELDGTVTNISADIFTDETTGATFYTAELLPMEGEVEKLKDNQILPGMPVDVLIRTGDRSPMDYLLKPLAGYFYRAFREE
ncbi:MAG TPA: HlyD family type I secretion periplasmic adaptor subunit [Rhodobacteraceae bacterium]|nr:HlyD family type I secretion periplasmic adaptor subunit [Paracoccaceae bacterium]